MDIQQFNCKEPSVKQKAKAQWFISRLKSVAEAEYSCLDYASAIALANYVSRADTERLCQTIHIYSTFVRITRNEKGSFAFAPVIFDHCKYRYSVSEG